MAGRPLAPAWGEGPAVHPGPWAGKGREASPGDQGLTALKVTARLALHRRLQLAVPQLSGRPAVPHCGRERERESKGTNSEVQLPGPPGL